ncbi:beta-N-acetylhexosaminidase [Galbibacter sp. EGI 63066]|uniref:beta-N-acetylhexosaminidase n=1 Tax=Galbibacter sp. EGI 63066 TaxID=2993559 RepID=UPI002248CB44|nr:beta-N-acetylhexosaminidase [Galbibacter sp. EGI 63066]MCX2678392.1 beta-N-acetylhexosaminidase [Galbibacter sp. EGI 63066]
MKKVAILLFVLSVCACSNKHKEAKNVASDYNIIPKPVSMVPADGKFLVDAETIVSGNASLEKEGAYLAQLLSIASGHEISFNPEGDRVDNAIVIQTDESIANEEGYTLSVQYNQIVITGKTAKGVFYGIQSLRQLLPEETEKGAVAELTIPAVEIEDNPEFKYRGMHLDVARHFFPVDFVKKYIDLIAMHKMNKFHWHLTEDQGWRIEIKKYPELTEVGGYRNGTIVGHHPGTENDNKKYGGFYTQEEIKEVVKYAAERHITVIPEIELPGHSSAAIAAYPSLSCFPEEPTVVTKDMMSEKGKALQADGTAKIVQETWGVFPDVYCAGKDETFEFLTNVLDEVIPLFPSKYVHIGGDECPKENWERCPNCQKRIKEEGLADEHELQSYFIERIEKYVNSKGKDIIGWDEILEGGLAPNATVMSWRGEAGGIEAAKQNHDVIMTPNESNYFDHYQSKDQDNEPLAIGGFTTVEEVYNYNPIPKELTEEQAKYILGSQGNVWTEYIGTTEQMEYMILPRMTALSEVVWSPSKNWDDFKGRLSQMKARYDAMGLNYAKHVFEE